MTAKKPVTKPAHAKPVEMPRGAPPRPPEAPQSLEMTAPTLGAMLMAAVNHVAMTGPAEAAHQLSQVEIAAGVLKLYLPGAAGVTAEPLKGRLAELLALLS